MPSDNSKEVIANKQLYWLAVGVLAILLTSTLMRDLERPSYGRHSWAEAHRAWFARAHLTYGLGYTKGLATWAVGNPPNPDPTHYVDHPPLRFLLYAVGGRVFGMKPHAAGETIDWGVQDAALRKFEVVAGLIGLVLLLKLLKHLLAAKTALLAGLLFVLFPLTGYFGAGGWFFPLSVVAFWCYLVLIRGLENGPKPKARHWWGLAATLFLILQLKWSGFFYAMGIGVHYIGVCVYRHEWPRKTMLGVLIAAPLVSMAVNFLVMAGAYGWEYQKIIDLYRWRAAKGETAEFLWIPWFGAFWEHGVRNFTMPVLVTGGAYLVWQFMATVFRRATSNRKSRESQPPQKHFPHWVLFLLPGVFQLLILRGCLWHHEIWERPLSIFVAVAGALGVVVAGDVIGRLNRRAGIAAMVVLVGAMAVASPGHLDWLHKKRFSPSLVRMFQHLNQVTPPHKKVLTYDNWVHQQHPSKGAHYRPEVAWYLDREMVRATTLAEVYSYARTGEYSRYILPYMTTSQGLFDALRKRYRYNMTSAEQESRNPRYRIPYVIFDLTQAPMQGSR